MKEIEDVGSMKSSKFPSTDLNNTEKIKNKNKNFLTYKYGAQVH